MEDLKIRPLDLRNGQEIEKIIESYNCKGLEEDVFSQELKLHYRAFLAGQEIFVIGEVNGRVSLQCFSCNERFIFPIEIKISQSFPSETEEIDLEEEIRQLLLLDLPDKPLCREDCKGLCPQCGKNLNNGKCSCKKDTFPDKWCKLKELLDKKVK